MPGIGRELNYRTVGGGCLRPGASLGMVALNGNMLPGKPIGIVDSGCDSTTLPLEWAARLGIDPQADCVAVEGSTAGGSAMQFAYPPGISVIFLGKKLLLGATFAPQCPHVLLGREDFFMYFKSVGFDQTRQKLCLVAVSDWDEAQDRARRNVERIGADAKAIAEAQAEAAAAATP